MKNWFSFINRLVNENNYYQSIENLLSLRLSKRANKRITMKIQNQPADPHLSICMDKWLGFEEAQNDIADHRVDAARISREIPTVCTHLALSFRAPWIRKIMTDQIPFLNSLLSPHHCNKFLTAIARQNSEQPQKAWFVFREDTVFNRSLKPTCWT